MKCKHCKKKLLGKQLIFCSKQCNTKYYNSLRKTILRKPKFCKFCKKEFIDQSKTYNKEFCESICKSKYYLNVYYGKWALWKQKYRKSYKGKQTEFRYRRKTIQKILMDKRFKHNPQLIHNFTIEEWTEKLFNTKGFCPNCKLYFGVTRLTMDHIIPISKSKSKIYDLDGVQALCQRCNSKKGNKIL